MRYRCKETYCANPHTDPNCSKYDIIFISGQWYESFDIPIDGLIPDTVTIGYHSDGAHFTAAYRQFTPNEISRYFDTEVEVREMEINKVLWEK
jgi:hypothetical protein